jgi:hypothetical protein
MDPESLPVELAPYADAIAVVSLVLTPLGFRALGYPDAPYHPCPPGRSLHRDGVVSPGVCVRVDLASARVGPGLRSALLGVAAEALGADGALYLYELGQRRSQRENRIAGLERLRRLLAAR